MKKYSEKVTRNHYDQLVKTLIDKKLLISTMESCTAGQIASLLTDTEGSSAIMRGAFVTYSNEAKILQGVSKDVIKTYTVYSEETACEMARACRKAYSADIGIGVTGTMANVDPNNEEASTPGDVYFAVCIREKMYSRHIKIPAQPDRLAYKLAVAEEIYQSLIEKLQDESYFK